MEHPVQTRIATPLFMRGRLLLVVLNTCLSLSVFAQSETGIDSARAQFSFSTDTVQAIHHLFSIKRRGANIVTGTGVAVAGTGIFLAQLSYAVLNSFKTAYSGKRLEPGPGAASLRLSLPGLFITTLGIIKRVRFSRSREANVISAYEQGRGLPPTIRQSLRPEHFYN